ncbi:SMP-30/gluconolactonase/LRE family protein [Pseudonocardia kujensis]|uniref:SMP-30/gluconolactonase/LRE family protein n=1 Tax=Pseudonocardia kujensis TaxID=1128675 RepID=UPI001E526160|nr:SMP-30/gluconolactonase/LRE family protein [Pseudonocardia kujensis]MCE0765799.1 SMP-30/gluconolactonase/LRE family protein [Pseudonocardia kujensis]
MQCFTPGGELIGKIRVPEATANLAFGGPKRNRLYITATSSLYAIYLNVTGAQSP